MKLFFALVATTATLATSLPALAAPTSSNVSFGYYNTRQFNTSRTNSSLGCTFGTCGSLTCNKLLMRGFNPSGTKCCDYVYICREDGTEDPSMAQAALERIAAEDNDVASAFRSDTDRTESYWGYVTTTNRSPSGGRGNSGPARLDACIGHAETDMLGTGSTGWANCYNKCDSTTNGYCNNTASNDGTSTTNAACKDRCDCTITGFGTCEGL